MGEKTGHSVCCKKIRRMLILRNYLVTAASENQLFRSQYEVYL